jgi:hypothetical protein
MPKTFIEKLKTNYVARYFIYNSVDISDYRIFPAREVLNAPPVYHFANGSQKDIDLPPLRALMPESPDSLSCIDFLRKNDTVAFLVIKSDRLLVEQYFQGYQHPGCAMLKFTAPARLS